MSLANTLTVLICAVLVAGEASAGGQRSFVASYGANTGTCTPTAPCRSFDYAIAQTAADGEIIVLDSAGYGPVTIAKGITIAAPPGVYAGVTVFSGDGITVNAGASDMVILRGLTINGQGGINGVNVLAADTVQIESCVVNGLVVGIMFSPAQASRVEVSATVVRNNVVGFETNATAAAGEQSVVAISKSEFRRNASGLVIDVHRAAIADSVIADNGVAGVTFSTSPLSPQNTSLAVDRSLIAQSSTGLTATSSFSSSFIGVVNISSSTIAGNSVTGLQAHLGGYIRVTGSQITGNDTGVHADPGGHIATLGTNMLQGNGVNGAFTDTLSPN